MKRLPVVVTFLLFVALCASAAYWVLQLWRPPVRQVAAPVTVASNDVQLDAAASLFGGRAAAVGVASNFQLKGVVVAENGRESVAILSADGKPAQAVRLNVEFQPGISVREVHSQYVLVSDGGVIKRVALPDVPTTSLDGNSVATPGLPPIQRLPVPLPAPAPPLQLQPPPQLQPQAQPLQQFQPMPPMQMSPQLQPVPQNQGTLQNSGALLMQPQGGSPVVGQMSTQLVRPLPGTVQGQQTPEMPLAPGIQGDAPFNGAAGSSQRQR